MNVSRTLFVLSLFLVFFTQNAIASVDSYATVDPSGETQDLTSTLNYSWQNQEAHDFEHFNYTSLEGKDLNLKYSTEASWLKINLQNATAQPISKILFFTTFLVGKVELYTQGVIEPEVTGSAIPFEQRSFKSRLPAFKIELSPFEKKTFYLKRTSHHSLSARLKLSDQSHFFDDEADSKATLYFYAGGIFCLLLFNLFIGLYTHDKDFLFYSLFAGTVAITVLTLHGFLDSYLFKDFNSTFAQYLMCFSSLSILSSLIFANRFFNLNFYLPQAKIYFKVVGSVAVFLFFYGIFFHGSNNWPQMGYVTDFFLVFTLVALIATSALVSRRGSKTAKFFLMSWAFMFTGVVAYFGVLYGLLPNVPIFYNGLLYGNLSEMLVISLGLAYKLNVLNFDKLAALEEASEKKHYHRLVKVLSHDVANASFVSSTYLSRLKKRITDPNDFIVFQKIESTLLKMNQILDSVRNEQAFKSFEQSVRLANVNLREVILDMLHFYEDQLQSKDLKVEVEVEADAFVLADRSALANQVISNILSNSIKFSKQDGFISIRLYALENQYRMSIEDRGIGIPKEQIQKIFFSDNHISTQGTHFERGSGIGCSLIREYMKLFNGSLEVESNTAQGIVSPSDFLTGTKITLIFPRANT